MLDEISTTSNINSVARLEDAATADASSQESDMTKSFPLFDLPPEIWSCICKLVVVHNGEILLKQNQNKKHHRDKVLQPAITRVCTAIRNETLPAFYSPNTFVILDDGGETDGLLAWIWAIGSKRAGDLKQLYVDSTYGTNFVRHIERLREVNKLRISVLGSELKFAGVEGQRGKQVWRYHLAMLLRV